MKNQKLNKYDRNIGNFILITGILHVILGFVENWNLATQIWNSGITNTLVGHPGRASFFWYEIAGAFVMLLGSVVQHHLNQCRQPIPKRYGYYLLIVGLIGCTLEPVSGFYIFLIIALPIMLSKQHPAHETARTGNNA
ncbi:hypothetical protein C7T94_11795 [Pedobacter yulinensis]|uniref:DUF4345 domain-containing protein n=1 Tax=Pedobacter yulinensis TaxID=2126353 RepID=A0A2T3HLH1_9SPHI|nr:DUF6463 family protein [Pedobacter yulinensis]PST83266.1 hypothetical protein C7T94_11795 [Pedobacter yulinensis]